MTTRPSLAWRFLILISVANVLVLALNAVLWTSRDAPAQTTRVPASLVSTLLAKARRPVTVVVSDFSIPLLRGLFNPPEYSLEDYATWNYRPLAPPPGKSPDLATLADILRTHRITRLGDLNIVIGIQRAAAGFVTPVVRHARDVSARSFTDGDAIMLGNDYSTPWVSLFEEHLNFPHVRTHRGVGFVNRHPKAGEQAEYLTLDSRTRPVRATAGWRWCRTLEAGAMCCSSAGSTW